MEDNLRALSRSQQPKQTNPGPKYGSRRWLALFTRRAPLILAVLGALLIGYLFRDRLLPAVAVDVETVVTLPEAGEVEAGGAAVARTQSVNAYAGAALFQASGWFEADPYPHRATALASGVVETVHVLEGQPVQAGDPIVTLIQDDARLRLDMATAAAAAAQSGLESAKRDQELSLARMESMRKQIDAARARLEELEDLALRARELGPEVMPEQEITQAELRRETQAQNVAALQAQLREREIETERIAARLQMEMNLLAQAEVRLREAQLEFDRMVIRAPVSGIIQRLQAAPGQKKVLMADHPESATVALLYQPEHLQARIDVPIAEAARLFPGQAVILESEFIRGGELRGYVQRIVGEADMQRNTLQVKVAIDEPSAGLRPEILCRARFLETGLVEPGELAGGPNSTRTRQPASTGLRILVPQAALFDQRDTTAAVWAVDVDGKRAERREIRLGGEPRDGYILASSGLRPGDRVIVDASGKLKDGKRIKY